MGDKDFLNPSFNREVVNIPSHLTAPVKKTNKKKHDIKIPVNDEVEAIIRREAINCFSGSKTVIATQLVLFGMDHLMHFPEVPYEDGPFCLHVKLEHEQYVRLGVYATSWNVSMRKAAHRVFIAAAKKKQLVGHAELTRGAVGNGR